MDFAGSRIVYGGNGWLSGNLNQEHLIPELIEQKIFRHVEQLVPLPQAPYQMSRIKYIQCYGPTVGDKVRLGDTELFLEIEKDFAVYGDEIVFGGGKVIRDGMGQMSNVSEENSLDLVITNVIVVDYTGIVKGDVGIKNHRIVGIGKAGNPDIMDGVNPELIVGPTTEVLSGEGKILVPGGIDTHVHFICPQICTEALATGLTTLIGGGT